jgi:PAS domain S-box-containing protein
MAEPCPATVLYVDDDADTRRTFRWIFEHAGYSFREAATGRDALQLASAKPDLVVLDVNLPDINGFEVCRRIKAHPATSGIPVLHLSAVYVTPEDRAHGLEEGADAYLTKPVEPGELLAHVHALLRIHQAEERARLEAQHWQATFDAISDGVCLLDGRGRVLRCNRALAALAGLPPQEVVGRSYRDLLTPSSVQAGVLPFEPMLASRKREVAELSLGLRWVQVTADPLPGPDGSVSGAVYILSDITERKRLEEQLRQAQKMEAIGQLAGGIAHDFNNLLTAITGNVSAVLMGLEPGDPRGELLQITEKAAWRAAELVQKLLSFSRRAILWLRPTDLNQCVREVVEILGRTIDPRIHIEAQLAEDLWPARADANQIHQVLLNLCVNARDAMPDGGRLVLETGNVVLDPEHARQHLDARPGRYVRLRVSDTGHGIPAEVLPHIFDPFFTTKPVGKGTGLGLASVFGIVKQHLGWVECHSAAGQGARFDIYLPGQRVGGAAEEEAAPAGLPAGGSETVLLVDDEKVVRGVGQMILERYGYKVLLAPDGLEALEIYQRERGRIGLVILDLTMPRLSGRDTLTQLLRIDPKARVLLASGYSAEHAEVAQQQGAAGFIAKPYRAQELARAVRQALDQIA